MDICIYIIQLKHMMYTFTNVYIYIINIYLCIHLYYILKHLKYNDHCV